MIQTSNPLQYGNKDRQYDLRIIRVLKPQLVIALRSVLVSLRDYQLREAMLVLGRAVSCRVASEADILLSNVASWVMVAYELPVSIQFKINVWTRWYQPSHFLGLL